MINRLYFIASLIYTLLGLGHIMAEFISRYFLNPSTNEVYYEMSRYYINVFGISRSIHEYMQGFSLTMGFLLFYFGLFNLLLLHKGKELIERNPSISIANSIASLVVVILSILYFHWPPIIGYTLSFVCFMLVYIKVKKSLA